MSAVATGAEAAPSLKGEVTVTAAIVTVGDMFNDAGPLAETALFRRRHAPTTPLEAARLTLRTLARRWQYLDDELVEVDAQLDELTAAIAPTLRAINGVGAQVATAVLAAAGDNPDRLRSEAAFAHLCGVAPLEASSGKTRRHRLNRGGDRQANNAPSGRQQHHRLNRYGDRHANWALHVIIISRLRWHPPTQAYMARRLAEGRTHKMVMRCLIGGVCGSRRLVEVSCLSVNAGR